MKKNSLIFFLLILPTTSSPQVRVDKIKFTLHKIYYVNKLEENSRFNGVSFHYDSGQFSREYSYESNSLTMENSVTGKYLDSSHTQENETIFDSWTNFFFNIDVINSLLDIHEYFISKVRFHAQTLQESEEGNGFSIAKAPYSSNGDTIHIMLKGDAILKHCEAYRYSIVSDLNNEIWSYMGSSIKMPIDSESYAEVFIIGKFPKHDLSTVGNHGNTSTTLNIAFDRKSKIITLSTRLQSQSFSFPCFDILGRKHNLEFLGADENSATYSIRSLKPGVYFVNDGKETVKFLVAE